MRIHTLKIKGLRRIKEATIQFGEATFIIGPNNVGKSTVFRALELLLERKNTTLPESEFYAHCNEGEQCRACENVIIEAEIRDVPEEAKNWQGFAGRIHSYSIPSGSNETGCCIYYRKTFPSGDKCLPEMKTMDKTLKPEFEGINKVEDLIAAGAPKSAVQSAFKKTSGGFKKQAPLEQIDEVWNFHDNAVDWASNPGGFPQIVLSKLPRFILIPANDGQDEITSKNGALGKIMDELFTEIREQSEHYKNAQKHLDRLASEMDPEDEATRFGQMMSELNTVLCDVFPDSKLFAKADLSKAEDSIKPTFEYAMSSNVQTPVCQQGTGMIRAAVFGLIRYRNNWMEENAKISKGLVIGFEEPEMYLHPNAANQMRDTIYELSSSNSQIVCTTHSPFMIDLGRKPRQVLNSLITNEDHAESRPFSVTSKFVELQDDEKNYVKMIQRMDDYMARVFFAKKVVVIEGDTEDIVIRETLKRLPPEERGRILSDVQVVKARGKASIIGLVKYLRAFELDVFVIHDRDNNTARARIMNEPIAEALGNADKRFMLEENIEDVLGYQPPRANKPYKAYENTLGWGDSWDEIPQAWQQVMKTAFSPYLDNL